VRRSCFVPNLILTESQDRHDEPKEIEADNIRASIRASHRFNSFAGERTENMVKWHVDGHDYMWAVSEMLESAKEVIFIQGKSHLGETQFDISHTAFYRLVALS
jgi:phosphatidylserine/phosphatidylglycerophosphate/cardiolipin synthase-like enzyme